MPLRSGIATLCSCNGWNDHVNAFSNNRNLCVRCLHASTPWRCASPETSQDVIASADVVCAFDSFCSCADAALASSGLCSGWCRTIRWNLYFQLCECKPADPNASEDKSKLLSKPSSISYLIQRERRKLQKRICCLMRTAIRRMDNSYHRRRCTKNNALCFLF